MNIKWYKISLLFFLSVALMGTLLRGFALFNIPLVYKNLVHAHSHVAFQGWVYTLLLLMVPHLFLSKSQIIKGRYSLQFKLTIFIITGVMISFIFQGYGLFSILFSSLFQLMNYWFIFQFFKDSKKLNNTKKKAVSIRFIKTGFWLGLLSTIAPWGIGILSAKGLANTEAYHAVIYFFLHFQYNGWFLFVLIGLLFKWLENKEISFNHQNATRFYWFLTLAVIPAYTLSLLGMSFKHYIIIPAAISAVLQLVSLFYLLMLLKKLTLKGFVHQKTIVKPFIFICISGFIIKIILQFISILPIVEHYAFGNRNFILAYLHLCLIGVISFGLITLLFQLNWLQNNKLTNLGALCLVVGFLTSEIILIINGLGWQQFYVGLFTFSALMAIGILILLISNYSKKLNYEN